MDTYQLRHYELPEVLSKELEVHIIHILKTTCYKIRAQGIIRSFKVFLTLYIRADLFDLSLDELVPNEKKGNEIFQAYAGFMHSKFTNSISTKYCYINAFRIIFENLLSKKGYNLYKLNQSTQIITNDIEVCIKQYILAEIDTNLDRYYEGWKIIVNKKIVYINLTNIHRTYAYDFTNKIYNFLCSVSTGSISTLNKYTMALDFFFDATTKLYPTLNKLFEALNSENAFDTLLKIKTYIYLENIKRKNEYHYTERTYKQIINLLDKMNYTDIFPKQLVTYHNTKLKSTKTNITNKDNTLYNTKLMVSIPLSMTDDQAKEEIFIKLKEIILKVKNSSDEYTNQLFFKYINFRKKARKGKIRSSEDNSKPYIKGVKFNGTYNPVDVGINNLENVFATYLNSPFIYNKVSNYKYFLKLEGSEHEEIFSINRYNIYPLLVNLVIEHPQITESWLINWKLFEKGQIYGFKKKDNGKYEITSLKKRKGIKNSLQTIELTITSLKIVRKIIILTRLARKYLFNNQNPQYEYFLLHSKTPFCKPVRISKITNPSTYSTRKYFKEIYPYDSRNSTSEYNFEKIIPELSLAKVRASVAVNIYFETKSVYAMSEALGHKKYEQGLLNYYLPQPLWDFFTERWIRLFQNALVYEAMKDSPYLFQAVDFKATELDQFLINHKIKDMPTILKKDLIEVKNNFNDIGVIPLSCKLLQWLIAIKNFVDHNDYDSLNEIAIKWYQTASFILGHIKLTFFSDVDCPIYLNPDIKDLYLQASNSPIDQCIIEKVLLKGGSNEKLL